MSSERYRLLAPAREDLTGFAVFLIEQGYETYMVRFLRAVFRTCALLTTLPGMGIPCHLSTEEFKGVRRFPAKGFPGWMIFYRPSDDLIEVVRILHTSRDWAKLFD